MDRQEHLISLKVHRVIPKTQIPFLTKEEEVRFFKLEEDLANQTLPQEVEVNWRFLSKSCGQIYLGETFSFLVKTYNETGYETNDLVIKVDLQLFSQRVINLADSRKECLKPQESHHVLLHHEIKEMGGNV